MPSIVAVKHAARLGIPLEGSVLRKKGFWPKANESYKATINFVSGVVNQ